MAQELKIRPDEVLLRRLPSQESVTSVQGRGVRANSDKISPRRDVDHGGASYSRFPPTTPLNLLEQLRSQDPSTNPETWLICWIWAREAMDLGMLVVDDKNDDDQGHCLVDSALGATKGTWKKLAKYTFGRVFDYSAAKQISKPSDLPGWNA